MSKKNRAPDITLVTLILACLSFIGFRLMSPSKHATPTPHLETPPSPSLDKNPNSVGGRSPGVLLPVSKSAWDAILTTPLFKAGAINQTNGCDLRDGGDHSSWVTIVPENIEALKSGTIDYIFGAPEWNCFRVGQTLRLYEPLGQSPHSNFALRLTATVSHITRLPAQKVPTMFLESIGFKSDIYSRWRAHMAHPQDQYELVIQLTGVIPAEKAAPGSIPETFFRIPLISSKVIKQWISDRRYPVQIINVGSASDINSHFSEITKTVPYKFRSSPAIPLSIGASSQDLLNVDFPLNVIMDIIGSAEPETRFVITAKSTTDARAFYALSDFINISSRRHIYWLYEGSDSL